VPKQSYGYPGLGSYEVTPGERAFCFANYNDCVEVSRIKRFVDAQTDRTYPLTCQAGVQTLSLESMCDEYRDGFKRNAFQHILGAASLVIVLGSSARADAFTQMHETYSGQHPSNPLFDQMDRANNFYGLRIGEEIRAAVAGDYPDGRLALRFEREIYPRLKERIVRFIRSGNACMLRPPAFDAFMDRARCM
jgi:hypothetical protein